MSVTNQAQVDAPADDCHSMLVFPHSATFSTLSLSHCLNLYRVVAGGAGGMGRSFALCLGPPIAVGGTDFESVILVAV